MRRWLHIVVLISILLGSVGISPAAMARQDSATIDLANVPLPVQALPEDGYQVLSGGYLTTADTVALIAGPRALDPLAVESALRSADVDRAYVLDLVLPVDRADANADLLAVVQTSVYEVSSGDTDALVKVLTDLVGLRSVTSRQTTVPGATSFAIDGAGGESLRTVVASGNIVIDIVSLDVTGEPDAAAHDLVVEGTLSRLAAQEPGGNLSGAALTVTPAVAFAHQQQTGVHGLYRVRDGGTQPAIGELGAERNDLPPTLVQQYLASTVSPVGTGTGIGITSVSLSRYSSDADAMAAFETLTSGDIQSAGSDPFFTDIADATYTEVGAGVYYVTGSVRGDASSGYVLVTVYSDVVVVVGYRAVGSTLARFPLVDDMLDYQIACLGSDEPCPPYELPESDAVPATPLPERGNTFSSGFGWMLRTLGPEWTIVEETVESGYDMVQLQNGQSQVMLESVINHHGQPVQCVLDELHNLQEFEEHADIRLWKDADGATDAGSEQGHAWSTYRVEPLADERADQEYVIRIDCYTLMTDGANLVISHTAPVDLYPAEMHKGEEIREAVAFAVNMGIRDKLALTTHDRRTTMIYFHWIDRAA